MLKLWFVTDAHFDSTKLKPLLAEHVKQFKKTFGNGAGGEKEAG